MNARSVRFSQKIFRTTYLVELFHRPSVYYFETMFTCDSSVSLRNEIKAISLVSVWTVACDDGLKIMGILAIKFRVILIFSSVLCLMSKRKKRQEINV